MSACSTVFGIMELLEQILSKLPPLEIIQCQRVCHTWKQLVTDSPLLQYKTWLRRDCPDCAHEVQDENWETGSTGSACSTESAYEHARQKIATHMSEHLNPIVTRCILAGMEFVTSPEEDYDGQFMGYLRPRYLKVLVEWYKANEASKDVWGNMPLRRPDAYIIEAQTADSAHAGLDFELKSKNYRDPATEDEATDDDSGLPLALTVGELMEAIEGQWEYWLQSEEDEHWHSHDGMGCDYDRGLPLDSCLDYDSISDEEERENRRSRPTFGTMLDRESHIDELISETDD